MRKTAVFFLVFISVSFIKSHSYAQWTEVGGIIFNGTHLYPTTASFSENDSLFFLGTQIGVFYSLDDGKSWTPRNSGLPTLRVTSFVWMDTTLFVSLGRYVFKSENYGEVWKNVSSGLFLEQVSILATRDSILFAGGEGGIYRSLNKGTTWESMNGGGYTSEKVNSIQFDSSNVFVFSSGFGLFKSNDNGLNWEKIVADGGELIVNNNHLIISGKATSTSKDGGETWKISEYGTSDLGNFEDKVLASWDDPSGEWWKDGTFVSDNFGTSWHRITEGLPSKTTIVKFLVSNSKTVYGIYNDNLWQLSGTNIVVANESIRVETPTKIVLEQNYPNPFNPSTTISFELPKNEFVTLSIYDMTGKEIERLVKGYLNSGAHSYSWAAEGITSGIYFYRLQTRSFSQTKKMILLK